MIPTMTVYLWCLSVPWYFRFLTALRIKCLLYYTDPTLYIKQLNMGASLRLARSLRNTTNSGAPNADTGTFTSTYLNGLWCWGLGRT